MALLKILEYPDPRLRTKARPVTAVDDSIRRLAADMLETMYAAPGVGLAATQVDVHLRLIVMDVSEEKNRPLVLINPEILAKDCVEEGEEGCLSVPGVTEVVRRARKITVRALDRDGKPLTLDAEGLLAVCIQHEMDHLQGKLFVDYLSELKRQRLKKKFTKSVRRDETEGRSRSRAPLI
jgi:peptide deformylase